MTGGEAPRRRGRPKGSTNKRAKDLASYVAARFGGSAVQQAAQLCMVTPAEVREAGGVLEARVAKAKELAKALEIKPAEAFAILSRELAALMPYTDKRQPQAIEAAGEGFGPSVVLQVGMAAGQAMPLDAEFVEVFEQAPALVSPAMSHDDGQASEPADLFASPPAD